MVQPIGGRPSWQIARHTSARAQTRSARQLAFVPSGGLTGITRAPTVESSDRSSRPQSTVVSSHALRLRNADGDEKQVPASSYYLEPSGELRPSVAALARVALDRDPQLQQAIDRRITDAHGSHEMSFRVKDAETGDYDKIFTVPVSATVAPLSKTHFDMLVKSTQPVLRALRDMLQVVYSKDDLTAKDLGIDEMPEEEQRRVLDTIAESLYFEPALRCEAMKDYPFLPVSGFDAAVGNLDNPEPVFFEYNLGTPSGLSNNIQLLEIMKDADPELFATIAARLPKDDTFAILKKAIDSNALAWTGNDDGISVVISPGVYNGAHPDVASIAMFSGMPMVNPSDLYEDEAGTIRLSTGDAESDPVVTGIYGRMEESFFLQNSKDGIPLRSPHYLDNAELGQRLGVSLEPGVIYDFEYDDAEKIVGVKLDADGEPKLQEVFESIGRDPTRPEVAPGSFAKAITGKKLYYSGIGGRVVDDKRIFQAVSDHLAPNYCEDEAIARPPRTLDVSEYKNFYDSEHLENYVVKVPDCSGGEGVMLMVNLTPERRLEVVEEVKQDPGRYIVQEFAQPAVMLAPEVAPQGETVYGSFANDWRIFTMMDADGNVDAGANSLLLRTAKPFSASTNTSQGGGYGVGAVLADEPRRRPPGESVLPATPEQAHVGSSRMFDLEQFALKLNWLTADADPAKGALPRDGQASLLAQLQRQVMDLLGRDFSPLMATARAYDAGEVSQTELFDALMSARNRMFEAPSFVAKGVGAALRGTLARFATDETPPAVGTPPTSRASRMAALSIERFDAPTEIRRDMVDGDARIKLETGRYTDGPHPFIAKAIKELGAAGGEVRMIREREEGADWLESPAGAYFRLDGDRPVIGIDLTQPYALAGLAHEREHFLMWQEVKAELEAEGVPVEDSAAAAMARTNETAMRVVGERRSVNAEMAMEIADDTEWNRGDTLLPRTNTEAGYVRRVTYPEVEGVRDLLHRARWSEETLDEGAAIGLLQSAIQVALKSRQARCAAVSTEIAALDRCLSPEARGAATKAKARLYGIRDSSVFESIFDPRTRDRFKTDGTSAELIRLYDAAFSNTGVRDYIVDRRDLTRLREQQMQEQQ